MERVGRIVKPRLSEEEVPQVSDDLCRASRHKEVHRLHSAVGVRDSETKAIPCPRGDRVANPTGGLGRPRQRTARADGKGLDSGGIACVIRNLDVPGNADSDGSLSCLKCAVDASD